MSTWFAIYVAQLNTDYINARTQTKSAYNRRQDASTKWASGDDHGAIGDLLGAMAGVIQAANQIINGSNYHFDPPFLPDVLELCWEYDIETMPEGAEVTWKSICEAWGTDDFEGASVTIAFIDRMRQLIWNEPFKVLWAAKPETEF